MRLTSLTLVVIGAGQAFAFAPTHLKNGFRPLKALDSDEFCVGVLGDLHIDPRYMEDYYTGREQWLKVFEEPKKSHGNVALVSLGDLGESKSVRPDETNELFAGTTECHEMAAEFLGSFGVPYEVVGGNHGTFEKLAVYSNPLEYSYDSTEMNALLTHNGHFVWDPPIIVETITK